MKWKRECESVDNWNWVYLEYLFAFNVYGPIYFMDTKRLNHLQPCLFSTSWCTVRFPPFLQGWVLRIFLYGGAIQEGIFKGTLEMYFPFHSTYALCFAGCYKHFTTHLDLNSWYFHVSKWSYVRACACVWVHVCVCMQYGVIPPRPTRESSNLNRNERKQGSVSWELRLRLNGS